MRIAVARTIAWSLVIAAGAILPSAACGAGEDGKSTKQEQVEGLSVAGEDPRAFEDARDLFTSRKAPLIDEVQAEEFVRQLSKSLASDDALPEGNLTQIAAILSNLDGARMSDDLCRGIRTVAENAALRIGRSNTSLQARSQELFKQGCARYEKGQFAEAGAKYRSALTAYPRHLDARNNLALSEMHIGNNAAAFYHLEILVRLAPDYAGALLNLSVVLERLGLSEQAYQKARTVADGGARLPMALYNAAWFENARGAYARAQGDLDSALEQVPNYPPAARLAALNSLESGTLPNTERIGSLPTQDRTLISNLRRRASISNGRRGGPGKSPANEDMGDPDLAEFRLATVTITADNTELFDGANVVGNLPVASKYVISESSGNWIALYWSANGIKRRVWLYKGSKPRPPAASAAQVPQPPAVVAPARIPVTPQGTNATAGSPATVTAPPAASTASAPATVTAPPAASTELSAFLGEWGEKWGDGQDAAVNNPRSITITQEAGRPEVKVAGYWTILDEKLENKTLSFRKRGGDSDWELSYEIKCTASGKMELTVRRSHDGKTFTGELYR